MFINKAIHFSNFHKKINVFSVSFNIYFNCLQISFYNLFLVWASNCGLEGELNILEPRHLCEKHFSPNYISTQTRRRMLVHTAVPEKYEEVNSSSERLKFSVIGMPLTSVEKKRKTHHEPREQTKITKNPVILNHQKRKLEYSDEATTADNENEKTNDNVSTSNSSNVYEEITLPPAPKRTYQCLVVKTKSTPPKTVMNYINPTANDEDTKETFFLTEEGNISSTNIEISDIKSIAVKTFQPSTSTSSSTFKKSESSAPIENCSEFIFNGEIYVQMPKRVFEEEKEKLMAEAEEKLSQYKEKLHAYLNIVLKDLP